MSGATMQCGRCGATNVAGDQFCGSCGAFLEWVVDPATSATPTAPVPDPSLATSIPVDGGLAGLRGSADAATTPIVTRTPSSSATAFAASVTTPGLPAAAAAPDADLLLRCPACGIANPADRTFCQSCGTTLAQARAAAAVGNEWAGLPPAAPTTSGGIAGPSRVNGVRAAPATKKGGFPGWIIGLAAVGILVGAVAVGGSIMLHQGAEPSALAGTLPPSQGPSATSAASSDAPTATPEPTPPPKGVAITLTGATASTVVGNRPKFDASKAIDRDAKTAWQEGAIDETGQWIQVSFPPVERLDALVIHNGYQLSTAAFEGNRRVKDIRITIDGGTPIEAHLKDQTKAQRIELGGVTGATTVRIEIVSTYGPKKTAYPGSPFDDAAISEISVIGVQGP